MVFNERLIRSTLSSDGILAPSTLQRIRLLDAGLLVSGAFFIFAGQSLIFPPRAVAVLVGAAFAAGIPIAWESVFFLIQARRAAIAQAETVFNAVEIGTGRTTTGQISDPLLGFALRPDVQTRAYRRERGRTIFDVEYSTDRFGRRRTPVPPLSGPRPRFLLFFGCSFGFGVGLNDDQPFPYYVAKRTIGYIPYNYSVGGYGPQQMLAKLQSGQVRHEVPEPKGDCVYLFIDHHVQRAIGSMWTTAFWGNPMPRYTWKGGRLTRRGTFASTRPALYRVYRWLAKSPSLHYFYIDLPLIRKPHRSSGNRAGSLGRSIRGTTVSSPFFIRDTCIAHVSSGI